MATIAHTSAGDERRNADHQSFLSYKGMRWLKLSTVLCLIVVLGYALVDVEPRHNGGSWYGYLLGTIGAGLIVWLSLLGVRKRSYTAGRWSLKAWTSAHVYLGLSLVVIGTLHTGFQLGWNVHTLAYALMMLVIISGIWGITVYQLLPTRLSDSRNQTTRKDMIEALGAIDRSLEQAAQPLEREDADVVLAALTSSVFDAGIVARLSGRYPRCRTAKALEHFSHAPDSDKAVESVRGLLRRRAGQLEQIRRQMRLRGLLDVWLFFHIPLTIALIAALGAHIVSVFYYW